MFVVVLLASVAIGSLRAVQTSAKVAGAAMTAISVGKMAADVRDLGISPGDPVSRVDIGEGFSAPWMRPEYSGIWWLTPEESARIRESGPTESDLIHRQKRREFILFKSME